MKDFFEWLGNTIGGPIGQMILGAINAKDFKKAADAAAQATEEQIETVRGLLDERDVEVFDTFQQAGFHVDRVAQSERGLFRRRFEQLENRIGERREDSRQGFLGDFDARGADLGRQFETRRERILANLEGQGEAERGDIDERHGQNLATLEGDLTDRGLGTSSLLGQASFSAERERGRELGFLNERLQRDRATLDASLSGDRLRNLAGLNESRAAFDSAMRGDTLNALDNVGINQLNTDVSFGRSRIDRIENRGLNRTKLTRGFFDDRIRFEEGIQHIPPSEANFLNASYQTGVNSAPRPSAPSSPSLLESLAPTAGAAYGGYIAAGKLAGGVISFGIATLACVDADAKISMANGWKKRLRDVQIGDTVLTAEGRASDVVAKDLGMLHPIYACKFVTVTDASGNRITVTSDHRLLWKGQPIAADDWVQIPGATVEYAKAVECGDLKLANGEPYLANGYGVVSNITEAMIEEYPELVGGTARREAA